MSVFAGDPILASDVNLRIATTELNTDSTTWTSTETVALSVTGTVVTGVRYQIAVSIYLVSTAAADTASMRIRNDNLAGAQMCNPQCGIASTSGNGFPYSFFVEWVSDISGSKTFVLTGIRASGTATQKIGGSGSRLSYMTMDKVNG